MSMSSIDKCKLEIKVRLKRLEKFAIDNLLDLTTETVLKFIEKTDVSQDDPQPQTFSKDSSKQSLLEQAKYELNFGSGENSMGFASFVSNTFASNLGSSLVNIKKEEKETAISKQILMAT